MAMEANRPLSPSSACIVALAALAAVALPGLASGQDTADCLACHEDRGMERAFVDPAAYETSVHGELECVFCHQDVAGADLPHADDLEPVDCSSCHDTESAAHAASLHGRALARGDEMAPSCSDCHGTHDIRPHGDPDAPTNVMNVPQLCGSCHREGSPVSRTHAIHQSNILSNYSQSIHGEGLYRQGLTVTAVCTSCHTSHDIRPHSDPRSSIHRDNITETCTQCHARIADVHRRVIEGRLWAEDPGRIPVCVDCHAPHKIRNVFYPAGMANQDCLTCHAKPELVVASALKPSDSSSLPEPASQGFGITNVPLS